MRSKRQAAIARAVGGELRARLTALEACVPGRWPEASLATRVKDGARWRRMSEADAVAVLYRLRRLGAMHRDEGGRWRLASGARTAPLSQLRRDLRCIEHPNPPSRYVADPRYGHLPSPL